MALAKLVPFRIYLEGPRNPTPIGPGHFFRDLPELLTGWLRDPDLYSSGL
jgi:hypothetical protein